MTKTLNRIIVILSLFLVIAALFIFKDRLEKKRPPDGFILVDKTAWDSLTSILPDTIYSDTVIYRDTTIYRYITYPETQAQDSALNEPNISRDSLVTPFYTVWLTSWIQNNAVIKNEWAYTEPDRMKVTQTIYMPRFYSVPIAEPCKDPSGVYLGGGLSYPIGFSLNLNYLNKDKIYGLEVGYIKKTPYIAVELGIKW